MGKSQSDKTQPSSRSSQMLGTEESTHQRVVNVIKNNERTIAPSLQSQLPPPTVRPSITKPNGSRVQYKKHEVLPPLLSSSSASNNASVSDSIKEESNQSAYENSNEIQMNNNYQKSIPYPNKINKICVQSINNNYKKNMPFDVYKENQPDKWMNMVKKNSQLNSKRCHCRQTQMLPPMIEDPSYSNGSHLNSSEIYTSSNDE